MSNTHMCSYLVRRNKTLPQPWHKHSMLYGVRCTSYHQPDNRSTVYILSEWSHSITQTRNTRRRKRKSKARLGILASVTQKTPPRSRQRPPTKRRSHRLLSTRPSSPLNKTMLPGKSGRTPRQTRGSGQPGESHSNTK